MTQKEIDDLGFMIDKLKDAAAAWLDKVRTVGNARETAVLEELQWMMVDVESEYTLGNFAEASTLYDNADLYLTRSVRRMTDNN